MKYLIFFINLIYWYYIYLNISNKFYKVKNVIKSKNQDILQALIYMLIVYLFYFNNKYTNFLIKLLYYNKKCYLLSYK